MVTRRHKKELKKELQIAEKEYKEALDRFSSMTDFDAFEKEMLPFHTKLISIKKELEQDEQETKTKRTN